MSLVKILPANFTYQFFSSKKVECISFKGSIFLFQEISLATQQIVERTRFAWKKSMGNQNADVFQAIKKMEISVSFCQQVIQVS